jgi:hypothetical protein
MRRSVSSRKSLAALLNFMACAFNASFAWWGYAEGSEFYMFNVVFGIFSGILALGNFLGYLDAKFEEDIERNRRQISGGF